MANPAKARGDKAEREVAALIADLTGWPARRKLGAGRFDDCGDIDGVPDTVIQVASYTDLVRAVREKLPASERQRVNEGATFAATFVRRYGGSYVVVLSPAQWATLMREATS